jgi:hypothetical protein
MTWLWTLHREFVEADQTKSVSHRRKGTGTTRRMRMSGAMLQQHVEDLVKSNDRVEPETAVVQRQKP